MNYKQFATDNARTQAAPNADYRKGFEDGIRCFAWWKDGVEYVGTTGKTLKLALAEFEYLHTYQPPPATAAIALTFCPRCGKEMSPDHDASLTPPKCCPNHVHRNPSCPICARISEELMKGFC